MINAPPLVAVEVADGVLALRLDRPGKKNALSRAMYASLSEALARAEVDPAFGAVLILGHPGAFSAGNDIADFAGADDGTGLAEVEGFLRALATFGKPLVAAVDGLAVGIGTTLLMHCDLVYATPASTFRTPFLDLGLVPEAGSSLLGPRLMGHQAAFALLVLGDVLSAADARDARLVHRIVDAGEVEAAARDAARRLAAKPRDALRIARDLLRGSPDAVLARIETENRHFAARLASKEARAAFAAFLKR